MADIIRDPDIQDQIACLLAKARQVLSDSSGLDQIGDPAILKKEIERRRRIKLTPVIQASNDFVAKNSLPLELYRMF